MHPPLGITARAKVHRVVDGDTLDVYVLGLPLRIRLLDCWAPEMKGPGRPDGILAKEAIEEMILNRGPEAVVHVPTEDADSLGDIFTFGRVLGRIWLQGDQEPLGKRMVALGFAKANREDARS